MTTVAEVPPARPADLRMARLHLRLGSLELARAELEAFAGAGVLDAGALLDLAEVRWRTGDVSGAGVAAQAYLGEGGEETLALVIAAEASAAAGRPAEARRLAAQALERAEAPLEQVFAGIPRSGIWPIEPDQRTEPAGELFEIPATRPSAALAPDAMPATTGLTTGVAGIPLEGVPFAAEAAAAETLWGTEPAWDAEPSDASAPSWSGGPPAPTASPLATSLPDPAAEIEVGRWLLAHGARVAAAGRLAVVLRLQPELAAAVLEVLAELPAQVDSDGAALELVRGDAYRLTGQEDAARRSYAAAAAALSTSGPEPS